MYAPASSHLGWRGQHGRGIAGTRPGTDLALTAQLINQESHGRTVARSHATGGGWYCYSQCTYKAGGTGGPQYGCTVVQQYEWSSGRHDEGGVADDTSRPPPLARQTMHGDVQPIVSGLEYTTQKWQLAASSSS